MNSVLLTVSGNIPVDIETQIKNGERPEADYMALAKSFPADLIDYSKAKEIVGRFAGFFEIIGGQALVLAWASFLLRNKYQLIFTDGEQVGIPLAMLLKFLAGSKRPQHFMIAHILSVKKKEIFFDAFRIQSHIDMIFVYSTYQEKYIEQRWKIPDDQVIFTPFMVDDQFFSPEKARIGDPLNLISDDKPIICAVGLEFRDYQTLLKAVVGLDIKVIIAAASPWSKREDTIQDKEIPENVIVQRFSQYDLRDVYAISRFVVMPLYPVDFQAGVTAMLEAMAMEKALICSRTPGQTDVVDEGIQGMYVPPQDASALRKAILELLAHPEQAIRMGRAGRHLVADAMNLEHYSQRLCGYVKSVLSSSR